MVFFSSLMIKHFTVVNVVVIIELIKMYFLFLPTPSAGYIALTSILLVDLLGLEKLTNAFGLLILFRGAAAMVGPPLAGAIYEFMDQSYTYPFVLAGIFFFMSAVTSFMAPAMKKCTTPEQKPPIIDMLTPIDEDDEEEEEDEEEDELPAANTAIPEIDRNKNCRVYTFGLISLLF